MNTNRTLLLSLVVPWVAGACSGGPDVGPEPVPASSHAPAAPAARPNTLPELRYYVIGDA